MVIAINITDENVYRSYWPPHEINFIELREDIDTALNKVEHGLRREGVTAVSVKVMHYENEVGTITASTDG